MFEVVVRYTGEAQFTIEAGSEEEAKKEAEKLFDALSATEIEAQIDEISISSCEEIEEN